MTIVYRRTDKVKIQVDDIVITVSPLSYQNKTEIQSMLIKGDVNSLMKGAMTSLKYAIKGVSGLKTQDGEDYQIQLEDGVISEDSLDDLLNLTCHDKLTTICMAMIENIPKEFVSAETNEVLEGVRIIKQGGTEKKI